MKVILSSYTDLGNPSTPKGLEPEWLGIELNKRNELKKVLIRGISSKRPIKLDRRFIIKPIPFGNKIPLCFSRINKIYHRFPSRYISHNMYDSFSKKHIKNADVLCCEIPSLIKQIREAKKNRIKVITFATSAHIDYTKKLMKEEYNKYSLEYNPLHLIFEESNRASYKESDMIFARSEYTRKTLIESGIPKEKIYKKPIDVFYNSEKFKPTTRKNSNIFRTIFVGQISFAKGVHYLLESWEELNLPNAELLMCGDIEELFKKTFNKYFNNKSIKFLGRVNPLTYLQKSDIFCFPSLTEGCSQSIVEAMACGLPVIATENSGSLARHGKEGFVVPIRDSKSFTKYIKYFYDNPDKTKEMGCNGIKQAKNYTIQNYSKKVVDYIENTNMQSIQKS